MVHTMNKNWETEEELSGHQAPKHKLSFINIYKTRLLTVNIHYSHHPYCCYMFIPGNLQPVCTSLFILLFIKSQYTIFAHLICFALFYSIAHVTLYFSFFFYFYLYICSCVVLLLFNLNFFALSTERTWLDLHFTSDYTLYNLVCDE